MKIVIDPGHGGRETGAIGSSTKEKDINLILSLKLRDELIANEAEILCTREEDTYLSLQERCDIANAYEADYFISLHCNSSIDKTANGTETYCLAPGGKAYPFAQKVQNAMIEYNKNADRGVKTANFYVLRETDMPAILMETMFISNPEEEEKLNDPIWQNGFAKHVGKEIADYLGLESKKETNKEHYAKEAFDAWKAEGIVLEDHDLDSPITWGEYVITQERLRNRNG